MSIFICSKGFYRVTLC